MAQTIEIQSNEERQDLLNFYIAKRALLMSQLENYNNKIAQLKNNDPQTSHQDLKVRNTTIQFRDPEAAANFKNHVIYHSYKNDNSSIGWKEAINSVLKIALSPLTINQILSAIELKYPEMGIRPSAIKSISSVLSTYSSEDIESDKKLYKSLNINGRQVYELIKPLSADEFEEVH